MTFQRRVGYGAALLGLLGILSATLTSIPHNAAVALTTSFWCLVCGKQGGVDVTLNVILFIPFAFGLRLAGMSFRRTVILSAALTIFVETMQGTVLVGRDPSLSDLLTNTSGGAIGAAIAGIWRTLLLPTPALARRLVGIGALMWLTILAGTTWLLLPWNTGGRLRATLGTLLPDYAMYSGKVLSATAGDQPLYQGRIPDSIRTALRERIVNGHITLGYEATVGRTREHWMPAVTLLERYGNVVIGIFEVHHDLVLKLPTKAERFGLRSVALRLIGGRPREIGEPVHVSAGARGRTYWLASSYGGEQRAREIRLSPSFGWSLLIPFAYAFGPEVHFLTALWLLGLLLPLGYWAGRAAPGAGGWRPMLAGLGIVLGMGLGLVPWLAGFPPVHRSEWIAALLGVGLGWAAASRVTYLAGRCGSPSVSESC